MKSLFFAALIASCALIQTACKYDGKPTTDAPTTTEPSSTQAPTNPAS